MSREEIFTEIKETLGQVPTFFQQMPEVSLEPEWTLFKRAVVTDGLYRRNTAN